MVATMRWNVRVVEYLLERGADPFEQDVYGFTARRKAEIKSLKTIASMLDHQEKTYEQKKQTFCESPVTNAKW